MVAAVDVTVAAIDDIAAGNLQSVLGTIYGKAQYAANAAGSAEGTANWAANAAGAAQGTAQYAADGVGFLDYHLRQIGNLVGYTVPVMPATAALMAQQEQAAAEPAPAE